MFDKNKAFLLAKISELVYKGYTDIGKELSNIPFKYYDSDDTQGLIVEYPDEIVIAFRGTESQNIGDFLTDINIKKMFLKDWGEVHEGFYQAINKIALDMLRYLIPYPDKKIYLTGHSMGGALATLFAFRAYCFSINFESLYTFGSPRVGDRKFATRFNTEFEGKSFRVVKTCDVITRIPTRLSGYKHVDKLIYIDHEDTIHADENLGLWNTFWDRIQGRIEDYSSFNFLSGISDHYLNGYIQSLSKK